MKFGNYDKINNKGLIPENTMLENNDVIISKVVPIKENRNDHTKVIKYEDLSRTYRTNEESYIDKNFVDRNGDGYNFCKVRIRTVRRPVIGDKFSSRHGQKGTIGNIIPECDMPYTAEGLKPDIIINPHAIPSRMTIGQLKETLLGKVLVELGLFGDGTSFGDLSIETIRKELTKVGYECNGEEVMYNGLSGEQIESSIFIGPVFYQRLKHMVRDKQHSRSIGPMVNLTRQPAEGRSRDGGLRFGEMERDCMVSHGASRFTRGRLYDASDKYQVNVCKKCGMIAAYNDKIHIHVCKTCDNRTDFNYVEIPYACKLLFQELQTMNIAPRIMT
jgi:DNA-directed RNA polymerase II subunit RPB2